MAGEKILNQKFIPPTKENIQEYKKFHYETLKNSHIEANKYLYQGIEECMPTDEEIDKFIDKIYNPMNMYNHDTIVPGTNYDYYEFIKSIQDSPIELSMIILLDKNKKPFKSMVIEEGTETKVGDFEKPFHKMFACLLNEPKAKYFIHVHNHPNVIVCRPSSGDMSHTYNESMLGNIFRVKMLDSCIISEFDFYSQYQFEKDLDSKEKLLNSEPSEELKNKIQKSDKMLYRFLMRGWKNGL